MVGINITSFMTGNKLVGEQSDHSNNNKIDFQKGEVNLENVSHEEAVATLKTTQDRVVLVVAKPESAFIAPASETSYSPQLCKCLIHYPRFSSSIGSLFSVTKCVLY